MHRNLPCNMRNADVFLALFAFHVFLCKLFYQYYEIIQLFPKQQISDSSKLKWFADDNFRFDENGREFSKRAENTVGKGGIAH